MIIGIVIIALVVGYNMLGNNTMPQQNQGTSSVNVGAGQQAAQPAGLNQSDLGDLNSGINQLNQDINKL